MQPRPLTSAEIALARSVFGDGLQYDAIRLRRGRLLTLFADGVTFQNTVFLSRRIWSADYGAPEIRLSLKALLIHELMHVWQHQNLPAYHWTKAAAEHVPDLLRLRYGTSVYAYEPGVKPLLEYRYEQQGRMLQDYFMLRELRRDVSVYEAVLGDTLRNPPEISGSR